jgi:hypothetical protein
MKPRSAGHLERLAVNQVTTLGPAAKLSEGVAALRDVLGPHGFVYRTGEAGVGSGGAFATGSFVRGDRCLELSFRHGLGQVKYRLGESLLDHEAYLRRTGHWAERRYPDFGADHIESFRALAQDIASFCTDFLRGEGDQFRALAAAQKANPNEFKGFAALGRE